MIYRIERGETNSTVKYVCLFYDFPRLNRVLFHSTESVSKSLQNCVIVQRDDVTLLTGGEEGTLRRWHFGLKQGDASRCCEVTAEEKWSLFPRGITSMVLNPTERYVAVCVICDA